MSCAFKGNPYVDRSYLVIQYQSSMELEQHAAKLQHAVAHGNQNKVNATSQNPPLSSALSVMDIVFGELDIISIQFSLKTSWQTNRAPPNPWQFSLSISETWLVQIEEICLPGWWEIWSSYEKYQPLAGIGPGAPTPEFWDELRCEVCGKIGNCHVFWSNVSVTHPYILCNSKTSARVETHNFWLMIWIFDASFSHNHNTELFRKVLMLILRLLHGALAGWLCLFRQNRWDPRVQDSRHCCCVVSTADERGNIFEDVR